MDDLSWFEEVVSASKQAAGLPADWASVQTPLGPEAELEDAPRPGELQGGSTAELLPYGQLVRTRYGDEHPLERLSCSTLAAPGGAIVVCDPVSLKWQGPPLAFELAGDELPVEVGVLRLETPRGVRLQAVAAVVGDIDAVASWSPLADPTARLSVDKGCLAFVAAGAVEAVARDAETRLAQVRTEVVVPVEFVGVVVGVLVEPGDGPWGYEVLTGADADGRLVAILVDQHVLDRS